MPDNSFLIKKGKVHPTAQYISESPFIQFSSKKKPQQKSQVIDENSDDSDTDSIQAIKQRNIDLRQQLETKV